MTEADWNRSTVHDDTLTCERISEGDASERDHDRPLTDGRGNVILFSRVLYGRTPRRSDPERLIYLPRPPKDGVITDAPEEEDREPTFYTLEEMIRAKAVLDERLAGGEKVTLFDILRPAPASARREGKMLLYWGPSKTTRKGERMWLVAISAKAKPKASAW